MPGGGGGLGSAAVASWLAARFAQDPAVVAATPVALALDLEYGEVNGRFFGPGLRPIAVPARVLNADRRAAIWAAADAETAAYLRPSLRR